MLILSLSALPMQRSHPCGWDVAELVADTPATVRTLLHGAARPIATAGVRQLLLWVNSCDQSAGRSAIVQLRHAHETQRSDAVVETLYGIALARGPEVRVVGGVGLINPPTQPLSNAEREAVRRLRHAAQEAGVIEAADELARLGLATRRRATLEAAASSLSSVLDSAKLDRLWSLRAQVELARGNPAAALTAAMQGVEHGDIASRRMLAIVQLTDKRVSNSAASLYLETMSIADPGLLSYFFDDIRLLLTKEEIEVWDALELAERNGWMRKAWEWRAATATLTLPERLAVHFERLEYALAHHRRQSSRGARPFDSLWRNSYVGLTALDDQGVVYVRHGPPDEIARLSFPGEVRDTWLYAGLAGGIAAIEFVKDGMWTDYYIPDPTSIRAATQRESLIRMRPEGKAYAFQTYYGHVTAFLDRFAPCGELWGCDRDQFLLQGASYRAALARAVFESETARPHLRKPLKTLVQTYAFRGRSGGTDIAAVMNVLGEDLVSTTADSTRYSLRFFSAADIPETHSVVRNDTILELRVPGGLSKRAVIRYNSVLNVKPALNGTIRMSVRNQADSVQGQIVSLVRKIPEFASETLALSDLVIAEPREGTWVRYRIALDPIAGNRLRAGQTFRIYYELYGIHEGDVVDVAIVLEPDQPDGIRGRLAALVSKREAMSLGYQEVVQRAEPDMAVFTRDITADLEPGEYTMSLSITRVKDGSRAAVSARVVVYKQ